MTARRAGRDRAADHRLQRPQGRRARRPRRPGSSASRIGSARRPLQKQLLAPPPRLCRADRQRDAQRRDEALQEEAPHVRRRGALRPAEARRPRSTFAATRRCRSCRRSIPSIQHRPLAAGRRDAAEGAGGGLQPPPRPALVRGPGRRLHRLALRRSKASCRWASGSRTSSRKVRRRSPSRSTSRASCACCRAPRRRSRPSCA